MTLTTILISLLLIACGADEQKITTRTQPGVDGKDGASCDVAEDPNGALITCGDSSVLVRNGAPGEMGTEGEPGEQGPAGADAPLPQGQLYFHGVVCNGLAVLSVENGPKFIAYGSGIFVLSTTNQTIWLNSSTQYCKVRVSTTGVLTVDYKP